MQSDFRARGAVHLESLRQIMTTRPPGMGRVAYARFQLLRRHFSGKFVPGLNISVGASRLVLRWARKLSRRGKPK